MVEFFGRFDLLLNPLGLMSQLLDALPYKKQAAGHEDHCFAAERPLKSDAEGQGEIHMIEDTGGIFENHADHCQENDAKEHGKN